MRHIYAFIFLFAFTAALSAFAADLAPGGIEVENLPTDKGLAKVVLIAGSSVYKPGEHDYVAGCSALFDLLKQTPGVAPVLVIDWPKKPETLEGAKAVVMLFDGGDKHGLLPEGRYDEIERLAGEGVGFVFLHQLIDVAIEHGENARALAGAAWEKGYSARAHWVAEFKDFPDHPIFRGVKPFKIDDGWLTGLRFSEDRKRITPLLRTVNPKAKGRPRSDLDPVVAWTFNREDGGRSVAFTGGHLHSSFLEEGYRRFLVNAILWSAGIEVPKSGAAVELTSPRLNEYLAKPMKK
jgi:hypothetical protein